jgi:photosystem II stability/assembly factor-like uncharacterized protein
VSLYHAGKKNLKNIFKHIRCDRFYYLVICLVITSNSLNAQWVKTNGVFSSAVWSSAASDTNLFVGTLYDGIFLSTDNGTSWTAVNSGLTISFVNCFAVSGINLYAGTSGGVYHSTNNGSNWTLDSIGLTCHWVSALVISATNLFAGTSGGGVFLSTNNGSSWSEVNTGLVSGSGASKIIPCLAVNGTNLFAGTFSNGVFRSTDNGTSWTATGTTGLTDTEIRLLTVNDTNLFVETAFMSIFRSTDGGSSWTPVKTGLTNTIVNTIAVSDSKLYAGTNGGVFLSTNNGTSWMSVNTGLTDSYVYTLCVSGTNLFAGTDSGVWKRPLSEMTTAVERSTIEEPTHFSLNQNYPNPFNPTTTFSFSLPCRSFVSLKIFDLLEREVATIVTEQLSAGSYSKQWNASNMSSGIYFYRLQAGSYTQTKKLLLLK